MHTRRRSSKRTKQTKQTKQTYKRKNGGIGSPRPVSELEEDSYDDAELLSEMRPETASSLVVKRRRTIQSPMQWLGPFQNQGLAPPGSRNSMPPRVRKILKSIASRKSFSDEVMKRLIGNQLPYHQSRAAKYLTEMTRRRVDRGLLQSLIYQAKFIEIDSEKIRNGRSNTSMTMLPHHGDKRYTNFLAELSKYNPSPKNGINVGDILYIVAGEGDYCVYVALPGKVEWLGDDGDNSYFMLTLLKYKEILDKYNVKYTHLFKNEDYYVLRDGAALQHIPRSNSTVPDHLLGMYWSLDDYQEILNKLTEGGLM